MTDVVWEDPPVVAHGGNNGPVWPARLAPLLDRPGEWARVHVFDKVDSARSLCNDLRKGRRPGVDPTEFEFTSRGVDGKGYVYARYIGGES